MGLNLGSMGGKIFGNVAWGSLFKNIVLGTIFMVVVGAVAIFGFINLRNKMLFKTPVSLLIKSENGTHKRRDDLVGGLLKSKSGVQDFVVKIPKQFKKKSLGYVPDFSKSDANGRLVFITSGDGMVWQQCEERLITEKEIELEITNENGEKVKKKMGYSLLIEPIPTDIKTITINNIHSVENIMESNKFKAAAIAIGAFILMVFVQIIFLFLTSKK